MVSAERETKRERESEREKEGEIERERERGTQAAFRDLDGASSDSKALKRAQLYG